MKTIYQSVTKLPEAEKERLRAELLADINAGVSLTEIASKMGKTNESTSATIKSLLGKRFIALRDEAIKRELQSVRTGEQYIFRVREKFRFTPFSFYHVLRKFEGGDIYLLERPVKGLAALDLFNSLENDGDPTLDRLCRQGASTVEMGEAKGMSRQQVEQYLQGSGQHKLWCERRNKAKKGKSQPILAERREDLINTLKADIFSLSANKPDLTPEQRAEITAAQVHLKVEYGDKKRLNKLYDLFLRFYQSREKGEGKSLHALIEEAGQDMSGTSRYFELAGLHDIRSLSRRSKEEKGAFKRASSTTFSAEDIRLFLNSEKYVETIIRNTKRERKVKSACMFRKEGESKSNYKIPSRVASQIYESKDYGYDVSDTAQITGTTPYAVERVLERRITVQPEIMRNLQILYPDKRITKPYLTTKQRSGK